METDERLCHTVTEEEAGKRIDALVAGWAEVSRSRAQNWLEQHLVMADGRAVDKSFRPTAGMQMEIDIPEPTVYEIKAENIPLDIVFEDDDLLVVNKPKGMVVHPAAGHYEGTLVNALMYHCGERLSGINGVLRPGIVHRIDMDTSGLLIVAKSDRAHQGLAEQIKEHSFTRMYEAVVIGHLKESSGTVDAPIGRHPTDRKKMAVIAQNSRPAVTHYEVLANYPGYSHVRLRLETGRTHQIRVHMAHLGHPVAGDTVYGPVKISPLCAGLHGQCLHAKAIGFTHPVTGDWMDFDSDLPDYFTGFLQKLQSL